MNLHKSKRSSVGIRIDHCYFCSRINFSSQGACSSCWTKFGQLARVTIRNLDGFQQVSLFQLNAEPDCRVLRELLIDQKDHHRPALLSKLADRLAFVALQKSPQISAGFLFPAPSASGRHHAHHLAAALGQVTGFPVCDQLRLTGEHLGLQKLQGLGARHLRKMRTVSGPWQQVGKGVPIFVDDILTTGATAMAAHQALGSPANFQVWTLAYQPFLIST